VQDRIQISQLILQHKARIVEDSTCVSDILNLFPSEHSLLKDLRAECEKLADELDTVSRERARLERKYNAMMGTRQMSMNRVDELKQLIQETKAAVASFDLLSQAAQAEVRVAHEKESILEQELQAIQAQLHVSADTYNQVKQNMQRLSEGAFETDDDGSDKVIEKAMAKEEVFKEETVQVQKEEEEEEEEEIYEEPEMDESYQPINISKNDNNNDCDNSQLVTLREFSDAKSTATATAMTTAESTPDRSAVNSSDTLQTTTSTTEHMSTCDEELVYANKSISVSESVSTSSTTHFSVPSPTSSAKPVDSEAVSVSCHISRETSGTLDTDSTRSQSRRGHLTTSVELLRKESRVEPGRAVGSSSLAPPPKPAKPRSRPPDKLSTPVGVVVGGGFGGTNESESEFVEISL